MIIQISEKCRTKPGIRQKIVLYADLQEVRNGEILGRHKIEQFCCRLEVDDLISNENLGVSEFVPRLLGFHDPGDGVKKEKLIEESPNKSVCLI